MVNHDESNSFWEHQCGGEKKNKQHVSVTQALCASKKDKLVYCYNNKKQTYAWWLGVVYKRVECSFFFSGWVCVYIYVVCGGVSE